MKLLPVRPRPEPEEAFGSWVQRVAAAHGSSLEPFVTAVREQYADAIDKRKIYVSPSHLQRINPDSIEHEQAFLLMAAATGLPREDFEDLALSSDKRWYRQKFLTPVGKVRWPSKAVNKGEAWYADSYCPECLAEGFFLQRLWRPGFPCACLQHKRALVDECPNCKAGLNFYAGHILHRHHRPSGFALACWRCQSDLVQTPRHPIAPQHRRSIEFLSQLLDGTIPMEENDWGVTILNGFHWWMEAFFQTRTSLPDSPLFFHKRGGGLRPAYLFQPCRVRYALLEAAFKATGEVAAPGSSSGKENPELLRWLRPRRWKDFCDVASGMVKQFPELAKQKDIAAPDRSILPSP